MLIAAGVAGVEKVKRQWLQLKPDQASWAQNSDMELLVFPMMVLYKDEGDGVVTLVLLEKNVEANLASEVEGCMLCVEATSKTWKWVAWLSIEGGRCDEVVENEL